MNNYLLCTDLDRTLIPNGKQPDSPAAHERFKQLVCRDEIALVYVTGRHRELIEHAMSEFDLPRPDFAISDVGSTIYQVDANEWRQWAAWDAHIAPDWCGMTNNDLYKLLQVFPALRLQEQEKQNRHKLSFYAPTDIDTVTLLGEVDARLGQSGIRANLIWSIDEHAGVGLLDVLPASANKLHAIEFLMQQQGYTHENTVFAGDSGNDLDVLSSHIQSILVANADDQVRQQAASRSTKETLYVARGGYLGMNGNYAAGILEGMAHYLPEVDAWLRYPDKLR